MYQNKLILLFTFVRLLFCLSLPFLSPGSFDCDILAVIRLSALWSGFWCFGEAVAGSWWPGSIGRTVIRLLMFGWSCGGSLGSLGSLVPSVGLWSGFRLCDPAFDALVKLWQVPGFVFPSVGLWFGSLVCWLFGSCFVLTWVTSLNHLRVKRKKMFLPWFHRSGCDPAFGFVIRFWCFGEAWDCDQGFGFVILFLIFGWSCGGFLASFLPSVGLWSGFWCCGGFLASFLPLVGLWSGSLVPMVVIFWLWSGF